MVTRSECYLWVFPPTDHHATAPATHDRFFGEQTYPSAEMGMGFSIIDSGWARPKYSMLSKQPEETFIQYSLSAPMWSWSAQTNTWRLGNILRTQILDGAPWRNEPLSDVLPGGLKSLPRIYGCTTCQTLFVEKHSGYPDVPLSANAVRRAVRVTKTSHLLSIADFPYGGGLCPPLGIGYGSGIRSPQN